MPVSPNRNTRPTVGFGATLLLAATGAAWLMYLFPEKLRTPAWIGFWAAGLLGFAGICVTLSALRLQATVRWLVCAILAAMAVIPGWIATSSAAMQCRVAFYGLRGSLSEAGCRAAFGVGTVVLLLMLGAAIRNALRKQPN